METAIKRKRGRPPKNAGRKTASKKSYDKLSKTKERVPTRRVYICSSFKGSAERNTARAQIYCRFAFEQGYVPWAPHLYYPQFLDDNSKAERAAGMKYALESMWQCCEVWAFGERLTEGMAAEIELARDLKIPVKRFDSDMEEIG